MSEQQDVRKSERVTIDTLKKRENNETEALEAFWNLHASIIKSKDIALSAIIDVTSCEELKHIDAIMQKMMFNLTSAFEDVELNAVTDIPEDVETAQLTTIRLLDEISASLQHKLSGVSVPDCHDKNSHSLLPSLCTKVPVHDKSEDDRSKRKKKEEIDKSPL